MAVTKKTFIDPPVLKRWIAILLFIADLFIPGGRVMHSASSSSSSGISISISNALFRRWLLRLFSHYDIAGALLWSILHLYANAASSAFAQQGWSFALFVYVLGEELVLFLRSAFELACEI